MPSSRRSAPSRRTSKVVRKKSSDELQRTRATLRTTRQQLKAALRAGEVSRDLGERLRAIFNQAAVGIAVAELDGHFVEMNQRFCDILGQPEEEMRQRTFLEMTHPDDRGETIEAVGQLLAGAVPYYSLEKRYVRKDGSVIWSLSTVTSLKDAAGRPERFIGVVEEITRRKEAERALREETRVLELLNETGRMLASTLDLHVVIQAMTDAATALSGAEFGAFFYNSEDSTGPGSLVPSLLSSAVPGSSEETEVRTAITQLALAFRADSAVRCDDLWIGDTDARWYPDSGREWRSPVRSYLAVPVQSRSGLSIGGLIFGHTQPSVFSERSELLVVGVAAQAGVAIDHARLYDAAQRSADDRKSLLESERAARTAAEHMSDMKDEFLATLSHEVRTPLNAILGWSQILRKDAADRPDLLKGLESIERNARVQTELIEDLLDMSRITSGKLRLEVQTIAPQSFVEAAIETVQPAAAAKNIHFERVIDAAIDPIAGDPARLQQVVWNLLSNAIKFTPKQGTVRVELAHVDTHVQIVVADTGIGIQPEFIPHLFERFRQGDASTTRKYGGLGIGLSIVKNLVELHGGTIFVKSPGENLGTTVTVRLPQGSAVLPAAPGERRRAVKESSGTHAFIAAELRGLTVLVVDDQEDARELLRRVLEECAATVLLAETAADAVGLVEAQRPDVLVTDIGMPDADGFELLRRIRALGAERGGRVPAIALTAFARSEDRTRALRAGFLVHVSKPVDASELVATVASVAGRVAHP